MSERTRPLLYLINPAECVLGYFEADVMRVWGIGRLVSMADLATPTVAALVPPHWEVEICDERAQTVDFETRAEIVGITGKISQRNRILELAAAFRARGKIVVIGGPYASLSPDDIRPHADVLVRGEIEEIAAELFADLMVGRQKAEYVGTKPDLSASPIPRWDLYPKGITFTAQVQTSRGCPFECEFCDVIQYLGRKQRWKEPAQVIRELDVLSALGYRSVFFADDNLTVMRRRARELLQALADWNGARGDRRMTFSTQVSIDITRDPDMLRLLGQANFGNVFIGIETVNEESLAETHKRQNMKIDMRAELEKVVEAGVMPICGIIVGFDHDGPDIFERQADFIQSLPVPLLTAGLLVAPAATPLYARMEAEGRLLTTGEISFGNLVQTNIRPLLMSAEALSLGMKWLINRVFAPAAIGVRIERYVQLCAERALAPAADLFAGKLGEMAERFAQMGPAEVGLLDYLRDAHRRRPDLAVPLGIIFKSYCQYRYMFDQAGVWEPALAMMARPPIFEDAAAAG